ncbi:MAG: alpha/beta fold hydrolase [Anaerolineae bacterium]|nr:alpha/beta fold hydrolase [Anaerolineae bacterium]
MFRHIILFLFLSLILFAPSITSSAQPTVPYFEQGTCSIDTFGYNAECGHLIVYENRLDETSPTIRLQVVILKSSSDTPLPDPVVYLEGGPGGSIALGGASLGRLFLDARDFILMEQRGNRLSQPWLDCPEYDATVLETLTMVTEDELDLLAAAASDCRDRFQAQNIDLSQYHSAAAAADFEDLRRVLGIEQWNLYGISYGTRLALTMLRDYSDGIRSLMLDSVYPPVIDTYTDIPQLYVQARERLFAACEMDEECDSAYPNLEQRLEQAVEQMNGHPVEVAIPGYQLSITGDDLSGFLYIAMYDIESSRLLPLLITQLADNNYALLAPLLENLTYYLHAVTDGKYWSVECHEEYPFNSPEGIDYQQLPLQYHYDLAVCPVWEAGVADAVADEAVVSSVPVLLMTGEFDSSTPPQWARIASQTLENSLLVEFPNRAHTVSVTPCGQQIITDFIRDPFSDIDTACVQTAPPIDFFVPADWVITTANYQLYSTLTTSTTLGLVFVIALGLFLVEILMLPLQIVRSLLKRSDPQPTAAYILRFGLSGLAIAALVFVVGLASVLLPMFRSAPTQLVIGIPRASASLLILPPLIVLVGVVLLPLLVLMWKRCWWSTLIRVHITAVAIAAFVFSWTMAQAGYLDPWF